MEKYENLFSKGRIGNRITENRFTAQAMESNCAGPGGAVSEAVINKYRRLAEGRWGVLTVEAVAIAPGAAARKNQLMLTKNTIGGFKHLVEEIRKINDRTLIIIQITHSGRKAFTEVSRPRVIYGTAEGASILSESEIAEIKDQFIRAAALSEQAGADGIELKMCHGYFGCEMLRPANRRNDRWGGCLENRARFLSETAGEIAAGRMNSDFLTGARISVYEGIRGGCGTSAPDELIEDLSEMKDILDIIENLPLDYLNVSAGIPGVTSEITRPTRSSKYLYLNQFRYAKWAKENLKRLPVTGSAYSVLGPDSFSAADENIGRGYTDFAGWGRQSLADPLTPLKLMEGRQADCCTACSGCSKLLGSQKEAGCIVYSGYYRNLLKEK